MSIPNQRIHIVDVMQLSTSFRKLPIDFIKIGQPSITTSIEYYFSLFEELGLANSTISLLKLGIKPIGMDASKHSVKHIFFV